MSLGAAFDLLSTEMMNLRKSSGRTLTRALSAWVAFDWEWQRHQGRILEAAADDTAVPVYRRARAEDLGQLRALQGACFAPELHDDDETIRQCIASDVHVVVEVDGQIVGAAVATTRPELAGASPLHLYVVEVHPEHQGRGVATALVRRAFRELPPSWIVMTADPVTPQGWRFLASFYPRIVPIGWPELLPNFHTAERPVGGKRGPR